MQDLVVTQPRAREASFDDLIGPYLEDGYRTALAILRNPVEAHDAVQEAAFKAWRGDGLMKDLRSEIRDAFQKEQATHPPAAGFRRSIVAATASRPRRQATVQAMAVAAALVIGLLVVVSLTSSRLTIHHTLPSRSARVGDYGIPPAGVPLIYLRDPNHAGWYTGFDWSGNPRGTIKLQVVIGPNGALVPSGDGLYFLVLQNAKGGNGVFLDRLGDAVPQFQPGAALTWADDNHHTCGIAFDQLNYSYTLVTAAADEAPRTVTVVARDASIGQTALSLASCSFKQDRAIAVRISVMYPSELWVIRLSDGQVLSHSAIGNSRLLANLVASADGTLIAENSRETTAGLGTSTQPTIIRRVADGSVVATLTPAEGVVGFSGDDSLALITTQPWSIGGDRAHLAVIDVASRKVIWRYDGNDGYVRFFAQPGGNAFAIMLSSGPQVGEFPITVVIVRGDGATVDLPAGYLHS